MRRRHHVALSTLLLLTVLVLFAREQDVTAYVPRLQRPPLLRPVKDAASAISTPDLALDAGVVNNGQQPSQPSEESNEHSLLPSPPPPPADATPAQDAKMPFQHDLDLELPLANLRDSATHAPHNYKPDGPKTYAFATFMGTHSPSLHDPYFLSIHSLIYRTLWSPRSRTEKYPFIVYVGSWVTPEQRTLLAGAGALVRELAPLDWTPNVPGVTPRWKDLFSKLNMWKEVEFERIIFLDADALPLAKMDPMFDAAPVQQCLQDKLQPDDYLADHSPVCEPYLFGGAPQEPWNSTSTVFNAGVIMFSPSLRMYERLLQNYVKTDQYDCLLVEQAFLNWQFSPSGAFPATMLDRKWAAVFPQENDEGKLNVVHEKIWVAQDGWMKKDWVDIWIEMIKFYESPEFSTSRGLDGPAKA